MQPKQPKAETQAMSEYGEPWKIVDGFVVSGKTGDDIGFSDRSAQRVLACVNSLAGIPSPEAVRELVEAAKAVADEYPYFPAPKNTLRLCNAVAALTAPPAGAQQK